MAGPGQSEVSLMTRLVLACGGGAGGQNFFLLTKRFTKAYANDAFRREIKFDNKSLRSVDLGDKEVPLHSESSFTLSRPKIIWFMCMQPPKKKDGGETTICDGQKLWKNLQTDTKIFFKKNGLLLNWREFEKLNEIQKVNTLSMISPVTNEEKQKLLEAVTLNNRVEALESIISFYLYETGLNNQTIQ